MLTSISYEKKVKIYYEALNKAEIIVVYGQFFNPAIMLIAATHVIRPNYMKTRAPALRTHPDNGKNILRG